MKKPSNHVPTSKGEMHIVEALRIRVDTIRGEPGSLVTGSMCHQAADCIEWHEARLRAIAELLGCEVDDIEDTIRKNEQSHGRLLKGWSETWSR